jgi:hypothetical protein
MEIIFVPLMLLLVFAVVLRRFFMHLGIWATRYADSCPPKLDNLDLTRFQAKRDNPNPGDEHYQTGASQETTP